MNSDYETFDQIPEALIMQYYLCSTILSPYWERILCD